jgi:transposase
MHMVGYFEGIASERGIAWRCSDSYSLRDFLRLENREEVPDHSWLSKTRSRLPHEVHESVFGWVLKLVAEQGLVRGKRIGVDASTMEANAALRTIVRRDDGRTYREMLTQMAKQSGIETPTADDLVRLDRARTGKKLSNEEWVSKTDPQAKIAKLKDGRTHLAYKPEHAVDLDTGIIIAAVLHPADQGDTTTIEGTLTTVENNLAQMSAAPTKQKPSELVADKGYHSRAVLKTLDAGVWKTRIAEPTQSGFSRWHGDDKARAVVYANRIRLGSMIGKQAMRRRAEIVERSFAHNLDRGGMRRTWLCGRENIHKRYLVHLAGHNLGILMRLLIGAGTPREAAARGLVFVLFVYTDHAAAIILAAASHNGHAVLVMVWRRRPSLIELALQQRAARDGQPQ